jgi:hypothetical protein
LSQKAVLERAFRRRPVLSKDEAASLASELSRCTDAAGGRSPIVAPAQVNTWFANKRKALNRAARIRKEAETEATAAATAALAARGIDINALGPQHAMPLLGAPNPATDNPFGFGISARVGAGARMGLPPLGLPAPAPLAHGGGGGGDPFPGEGEEGDEDEEEDEEDDGLEMPRHAGGGALSAQHAAAAAAHAHAQHAHAQALHAAQLAAQLQAEVPARGVAAWRGSAAAAAALAVSGIPDPEGTEDAGAGAVAIGTDAAAPPGATAAATTAAAAAAAAAAGERRSQRSTAGKRLAEAGGAALLEGGDDDSGDEDGPGGGGDAKRRRVKGHSRLERRLRRADTDALEACFQEAPAPNLASRNAIAEQLGLTLDQVSLWYKRRQSLQAVAEGGAAVGVAGLDAVGLVAGGAGSLSRSSGGAAADGMMGHHPADASM